MTRNHFELFDLTPSYSIDTERLERSYKEVALVSMCCGG